MVVAIAFCIPKWNNNVKPAMTYLFAAVTASCSLLYDAKGLSSKLQYM
jgi:formate-dependent nitrite reductase membrane component NrfD